MNLLHFAATNGAKRHSDEEIDDKCERKKLREKNRRSEVNDKFKELADLTEYVESSLMKRIDTSDLEKTSSQKSDLICKVLLVMSSMLEENRELKATIAQRCSLTQFSAPQQALTAHAKSPNSIPAANQNIAATEVKCQLQGMQSQLEHIIQMQYQLVSLNQNQSHNAFGSPVNVMQHQILPPSYCVAPSVETYLHSVPTNMTSHLSHPKLIVPPASLEHYQLYTQQQALHQHQHQHQPPSISRTAIAHCDQTSCCSNGSVSDISLGSDNSSCIGGNVLRITANSPLLASSVAGYESVSTNSLVGQLLGANLTNMDKPGNLSNSNSVCDVIPGCHNEAVSCCSVDHYKNLDDFLDDEAFQSVFSPFLSLADCDEDLPPTTHAECA